MEVSSGSVSEGGLSSPSLLLSTEERGFTAREKVEAVEEKRPIMLGSGGDGGWDIRADERAIWRMMDPWN